ncbi:MAG: hypothetical protein KJ571_11740 [Bacteroidetes bacterium]|nr:hypothetical protein [Bacteroidota bacterium]
MLSLILITFSVLIVSMVLTAKGVERKEKASVECELIKYCDLEKQKSKVCSSVKESSYNYLTIAKSK